MSRFGLYFHTVRHLRPVQLAARVWFRIRRPRPDLSDAPQAARFVQPHCEPVRPPASMPDRDRFRFLEVERRCASAADWNPPDTALLWTYNLHYFDDLNAVAAESRIEWHRALLKRWVAENPPARGVGWDPYPVSRRIVNWVKWCARGNELPPECVASLAVQARWLMGRLEYHILGNHLLVNGKALVYAGLCFTGPEAAGWLERGLRILERETREQVLGDGGHFELSTQYHALVLEDYLDLINVMRAAGRDVPSAWLEVAPRMLRWLQAMVHPDGEISFFNDAAFGIAPTLRELRDYAARLHIASESRVPGMLETLGASGYVRADVDRACLICDCAAVGPDYQPGHAHADTLSFELSLAGRRLLVNSGTSEYGTGPERQRQRGTEAHNTVVVDRLNSSEVWGGFRVARRARATLEEAVIVDGETRIVASHDGYRRLPGHNLHRRRWRLRAGELNIEDEIEGSLEMAEAYFHFHPEVAVERSDAGDRIELTHPQAGRITLEFAQAAHIEIREGTWHPEFGRSVANRHVIARFAGRRLTSRIHWDARV